MTEPIRGMWVARFHYRYADDVRTIIRSCAELGCNTVYWQVRGAGTVLYPSRIEPWAPEFDYADPGFDPLALAVEEAHKHGLRLEAWVNVMPGWRGTKPPPMPEQLWNARPGWFLHDAAGRRQPLGDFYEILNPCLPEVRRYLVTLMAEIVHNYDVDGLHLDYIRYAWDTLPNASKLYPRDARTLRLYRNETGKSPDDDPRGWDRWRANQLTRLVADIRAMINRQRPGASLTAAVVRRPDLAYDRFLQNGIAWHRTGLVDALLPMAYTDNLSQFREDIAAYRALVPGGRIVPGIGVYKLDSATDFRQQMELCRGWGGGFALFSYESLYVAHGDRRRKAEQIRKENATRAMRRSVVSDFVVR